MNLPPLSAAAMDALTKLAGKPRQAVDHAAYRELAAHGFVMAGADDAHITQTGKSFWLRSQGKEPA